MKNKLDEFERSIQEKLDQHEVYVPSTIWNSIKANLPDEKKPSVAPFIFGRNVKSFSIIGLFMAVGIGASMFFYSQNNLTNSTQETKAEITRDENNEVYTSEKINTDDNIQYSKKSNTDKASNSKNTSEIFPLPNNNIFTNYTTSLNKSAQENTRELHDNNNPNNTYHVTKTSTTGAEKKTRPKQNTSGATNRSLQNTNNNTSNTTQNSSNKNKNNFDVPASTQSNLLSKNTGTTKSNYSNRLNENHLNNATTPNTSASATKRTNSTNGLDVNTSTSNQTQGLNSNNTSTEQSTTNSTSSSEKNLQQQTTDSIRFSNTSDALIASNTSSEQFEKSNTNNTSNSNQLEETQSNSYNTTNTQHTSSTTSNSLSNKNNDGLDPLVNTANTTSILASTAATTNNQEQVVASNSILSEKTIDTYSLDSTDSSNTSNKNLISNNEKQIDSISEPVIHTDTTATIIEDALAEKIKPQPTLLSKITIDGYVSPAIAFIQTTETNNKDSSIYTISQNKKTGFGLTLGLRANYILSPKFEIGAGLQYSSTNQPVDYTFQSIDSTYTSYQGYNQIDSTYDSTSQAYTYTNTYILTDSTTNTFYSNQSTSATNKYQNISIPIYVAYSYRISDRLRLVARSSILFNLATYSITYTASNNELIGYHSEKKISIGGSLSVGGYYTLNNSVTLFAEPIFTYYFKDIFKNEAPFKQSLMSIGLQTGLRINF